MAFPRAIYRRLLQTSYPYTSRAVRPTIRLSARASSTTTPTQVKSFWTGGRVALLTAFAASVTYLIGVNDTRNHAPKREQPKYAGKADLEKAVAELTQLLGEDGVSTDEEDLHSHGFSEWSSINADRLPVAITYPRSTEDVSKIAKICHKYKIPMVPYSGGSSLEGNFSAPLGGMTIDFAYMDKILAIRPTDMDVTVQPSVPWMSLNEHIKKDGLLFPVDPGPTAQIGGMVGTGCSGTGAVRYGTMRDWVINLTVVLADGTIIKTRQRPRKSSAGYNLTHLFVGSEGTLGLVTEITLKLTVLPQTTSVAVVTFPTIRDAAAAANKVMRQGIPVAAMEILDEVQMNIINRGGSTGRTWKELPTLFFKFGGTKKAVEEHVSQVKAIAKAENSADFDFATDAKEQEALWSARKQALWSMLALKRDGDEAWSTDVAVPFSRLPDLIEATKRDLDASGLFASCVGHIGDGNFHTTFMYQKSDPAERAKVEKCVHDQVERAIELEGTCTGEHGIGMGKKESLLHELGVDTVETMRAIKLALDPFWLLNPGKIMDS